MSKLKRRLMALSLTSVLAALGVHSAAAEADVRDSLKRDQLIKRDPLVKPDRNLRFRTQVQGYLVRGEKGEYYYLTKAQLAALAHKGKCHKSQCARVAPSNVIVKKRSLARFLLRSAQPFSRKLREKSLVQSMDMSIQRRQLLGAQVRDALSKQGFEVGVLYPTKAG